jgi:hypothetical protein
MARRYRSLHFGNMDGKNVVFHREHRSKRGRMKIDRKSREQLLGWWKGKGEPKIERRIKQSLYQRRSSNSTAVRYKPAGSDSLN